jgi:hypothetical protein
MHGENINFLMDWGNFFAGIDQLFEGMASRNRFLRIFVHSIFGTSSTFSEWADQYTTTGLILNIQSPGHYAF